MWAIRVLLFRRCGDVVDDDNDRESDGELDLYGTPWEKFAHLSDAPNLGSGFDLVAFYFRRAAEALAEHEDLARHRHFEMPITFLCRHYIELSLKGAWEDAQGLGFDGGIPPRDHSLLKLWEPVQSFCESVSIIHEASYGRILVTA